MSRLKLVPLLAVLSLLFLTASQKNSFAANSNPNNQVVIEKIEDKGGGLKEVTFRDAQGNVQLAAIDCSGVSGIPGISALCGALDSGLDTLGTSITSSIGQIVENFRQFMAKNSWELIFNDILSPLIRGLADVFWGGLDPTTYNPQNPSSLDQQSVRRLGIFPFRLVAAVYQNPPDLGTFSSLSEIINQNILGVKTSLAQYTPGRNRLSPMFDIWQGIRNVAYLIVTLILVIYGFLVMLRQRIDPRTIVTVQSAIPRLAIGLLAIAFSYTIASLAIDIGQVGLASITSLFNSLPQRNCVLTSKPCFAFPFLDDPRVLNTGFDLGGPKGFGWFDGLVDMILGLVVWYMFFQIFFALITNYAQIFVKAALGPLLIAFGILPNQTDSVRRWFMGLLANALVFPAIYFILDIAVYINNYETALTLPDPINQFNAKSFVILGLIVVATKVPAIIEETLNATPSGAVARAGADVAGVVRKIPVIGGFVG